MFIEDCHRCHTPKLPGHNVVCALNTVADVSFWAGCLCLLAFWASLITLALSVGTDTAGDWGLRAVLFGVHAGLLLLLSLATGMRAKWLRHSIVADMDEYLDDEGTCCGGACAGSCGTGGCSDEGCDDESCRIDESELPPDDMEGGCCGGGCCN